MSVRKSSYYSGQASIAAGSAASSVKRIVAMLAVVFMMALSFVTAGTAQANAGGFADVTCALSGDLGLNTAWKSIGNVLEPDANSVADGSAKMSIQDLYGDVLNWTTYNGTRHPDSLAQDKNNLFNVSSNNGAKDRLGSDIADASKKAHTIIGCPMRALITMISGTILGTAGLISNFTSIFVTKAVDPSFICQDPKNTSGATCINLLAVIAGDGGAGDDGGIIGRLYSGLYMGLSVMAFLAVAVWAAWTGLAKRKLTSALGGIFTAIVIFGAGILLMGNPLMIAQLPMRVGTTMGGCVIMGVSGVNCMSSTSSDPNTPPKENTECYVDDAGDVDVTRSLALVAKQATCKTWEAFVFQPWVAGQFGTSYKNLDTGGGPGEAGPLFQKTSGTLDYWKNIKVGMYAADSKPTSICTDSTSGYTYSNVALYQLNLMSNIHACGKPYHQSTAIKTNQQVYSDWVYVVDAMSQAQKAGAVDSKTTSADLQYMWSSWIGSYGWNRMAIAVLAVVCSLGGAAVLITTAALAIMYLFTGVLLTAFAPLFFLIGIVPGQGKKIFLGWVEKIASAILKYFACVLWMMVTLELYSAVLAGANNGLGATLIFVVIVTLAMWMYRDEFLKMIGRANFGGTQFSNKLGDMGRDMAKGAGRLAGARAAGFAAGMVTGDGEHETYDKSKKWKAGEVKDGHRINALTAMTHNAMEKNKVRAKNAGHRLRGAHDQAGWSTMQQLKRGTGLVAQAARAYDVVDDKRRGEVQRKLAKNSQALQNARGVAYSQMLQQLQEAGVSQEEAARIASMNSQDRAAKMAELHGGLAADAKQSEADLADARAERSKAHDRHEDANDIASKMFSVKQLESFRSGKIDGLSEEQDSRLEAAYHANGKNLGSYQYAKDLMARQAAGEQLTTDDMKRVAALDGVIRGQIDEDKAAMVAAVHNSSVGAEMLQKAGVADDADYESAYAALTAGGKNSAVNQVRLDTRNQLETAIANEHEADDAYQSASTQLSASMQADKLAAAVDQINRQQAVNEANSDTVRRRNMSFHTKGRTLEATENMSEYAAGLVGEDGTLNVGAAANGPAGDTDFSETQRGVARRAAAATAHGVSHAANAAGNAFSNTVGQVEVDGETVNDRLHSAAETVQALPSRAAWAANDAANVVQYAAGDAADRAGHAAAVGASAAIDAARAGFGSARTEYSAARDAGAGFFDAAGQAVSYGADQAARAAAGSVTQDASAQELGHDSGSVFGQFQQSVDESRSARQAEAAQRRQDRAAADSAWQQERESRATQRAMDDGGAPSMFQQAKYAAQDLADAAQHAVQPVLDYGSEHNGSTEGDKTKVFGRPWDASGPKAGSTAGYKYGRLTEDTAKKDGVDTSKFRRPGRK